MDETHSIYVDQWDWEKVILKRDRTIAYLQKTVKKIVKAVCDTSKYLQTKGFSGVDICEDVKFITTQELLDLYPSLTPKQREYEIVKKIQNSVYHANWRRSFRWSATRFACA